MPTVKLPTGIEMYYESHGAGEPLVLLPSTAFASAVWHLEQVRPLAERLNLIILDVRGTGRSSRPDRVYTIEQMAADVIALLDHLGVPAAHVLGHSMGGRIALTMALDHPGRVKSLICAATGSGIATRAGEQCVVGVSHGLVMSLLERGFEGHVRHEIMEAAIYFTPEFRAQYPDRVQALYDVVWRSTARPPEYLRLVAARQAWEATHRLGDVAVPTLVVVGSADTGGSNHVQQAEALAARIPGAEYKVLPGQTHGFFWEQPAETNAWILDWVLGHAG
ncbi:MAG TPA: alpha/beta fold hydrolase [Chloroflexota bacterium]|jgi:pimeloyl-ACP methyl ester carboxylesterase